MKTIVSKYKIPIGPYCKQLNGDVSEVRIPDYFNTHSQIIDFTFHYNEVCPFLQEKGGYIICEFKNYTRIYKDVKICGINSNTPEEEIEIIEEEAKGNYLASNINYR